MGLACIYLMRLTFCCMSLELLCRLYSPQILWELEPCGLMLGPKSQLKSVISLSVPELLLFVRLATAFIENNWAKSLGSFYWVFSRNTKSHMLRLRWQKYFRIYRYVGVCLPSGLFIDEGYFSYKACVEAGILLPHFVLTYMVHFVSGGDNGRLC